jgi:hypothetical protein
MRRRTRALAPVLAIGAAALLVMPVLAGNLAVVTLLDDGTPVAGEEHELRLELLQHGVTPVLDGTVQVVARSASGDEVAATATSIGGGAWIATIAFPVGGAWEIAVTHSQLATTGPMILSVSDASAAAPEAPSTAALALALAGVCLVGTGFIVARRGSRASGPSEGLTTPG